jgi:NitT/TauT family transport system substrate-binding protein
MTQKPSRAAPSRRALIAALALAGLATPALAQAPVKLKLQTIGANASTIPDLYARTQDLYRKHGLDVEFLPPIFNANGAMQMVVQGAADVTYSGGSSIVQVVQQGRRIKAFGVVMQGLELKVSMTKPGLEKAEKAGATPSSPLAARVNAMKGMRIGAPATGSSSDLIFRYSLKRFGLDPNKDLAIQPMTDMTAIMAAVRQGAVDGIAGTSTTANARAEAEGSATRYIAFEEDDPLLRAYPTYILAASDEFIQKNPEAVKRLLAVFADAKKAIRRGLTPEEIAAIKKQFFPDMADQALAYSLNLSLPLLKGPLTPTPVVHEALIKTNNAVADVPATVTFEQAFVTAAAAEADKN